MAIQTYVGTYQASKASSWWPNIDYSPKTNYQRWVTAHATTYGDLPTAASYQSVSYNFALTSPATTYAPPTDDTYRQAAHDGSSPTGDPLDGHDFLQKGNYVHPILVINSINGVTIAGKVYYAGSATSFNPTIGTITRDYLEIISISNLASTVPLVDGNSYTIVFSDTALLATYSQDFNTLANVGVTATWTDNATIAEWYAFNTVLAGPPTTYRIDNGTGTTGALYSYGTTSATDRALGVLPAGTTGTLRFAYKYTNATGTTINTVRFQYTGEQWRSAAAAPQTLTFDYCVNATSITVGTYTAVTALNFTSPNLSGAGAIDGNNPANQSTKDIYITVAVTNGSTIWFRWNKTDSVGADHGLAVDNVQLTFFS